MLVLHRCRPWILSRSAWVFTSEIFLVPLLYSAAFRATNSWLLPRRFLSSKQGGHLCLQACRDIREQRHVCRQGWSRLQTTVLCWSLPLSARGCNSDAHHVTGVKIKSNLSSGATVAVRDGCHRWSHILLLTGRPVSVFCSLKAETLHFYVPLSGSGVPVRTRTV